VALRPFHALTNFARTYARARGTPSAPIVSEYNETKERLEEPGPERRLFWETLFREQSDPYVKTLDRGFCGNFS
jgi:hypothetical protein